jgi:fatty-acyl-CoA synthase
MIKTGGINVAPAEVEDVLQSHPNVQLAYVVGVPDRVRDEVIGAVVVRRAGHPVAAEELVAFCRQSLAELQGPAAHPLCGGKGPALDVHGKAAEKPPRLSFFLAGDRVSLC